jgi:hypothetical protein
MKWPILRDVFLFFGGMSGVVHETLLARSERPTLLILFAAMMGLPAFLQGGAAGAADRGMRGTDEVEIKPRSKRHLRWVEEAPEEPPQPPTAAA